MPSTAPWVFGSTACPCRRRRCWTRWIRSRGRRRPTDARVDQPAASAGKKIPAECAGKKKRENVHETGDETPGGVDRVGRRRRPAGRRRGAGARRPLQGGAFAGRAGESRQAAASRAAPAGKAAGGAGGREGRRVWRG